MVNASRLRQLEFSAANQIDLEARPSRARDPGELYYIIS